MTECLIVNRTLNQDIYRCTREHDTRCRASLINFSSAKFPKNEATTGPTGVLIPGCLTET